MRAGRSAARATLAGLVLLGAGAWAADLSFPKLSGRVVDEAALLSPDVERRIGGRLEAHERATRNQVVVVTVRSLEGRPIEDYGYQLGRHWGIGQKGEDNGVLLIVAPNERKVRIEVGYGLEGVLTDAIAANVIQTIALPAFKRGDFEGGVEASAEAVVAALGGRYQMRQSRSRPVRGAQNFIGTAFVVLVFILVIGAHAANVTPGGRRWMRRHGMYVSGTGGSRGRFGGGGFRGGGGSFGGGGASGGW